MDGQDGAAVAGGALSRRARLTLLAAAAVLAVVVLVVGVLVVRHARTVAGPSASTGGGFTPGPSLSVSAGADVPLPSTADASDVFDGWSTVDGGGRTRFLASDTRTEGRYALVITRPAGDAPAVVPAMTQTLTVAQDSVIRVVFAAESDGSPAAGAVQVRLGDGAPAVAQLPAGPFGWQRFSLDWRVPRGVTTASLAITVPGETSGTRIDDIEAQGDGSKGVVVANGGFESNGADLQLETPTLVLHPGAAAIPARTRRPGGGRLSWSLSEYTGGAAITGASRFRDGAATVDLRHVPDGYYRLTVQAQVGGVTTRRTTDLVVADPPGSATPTPLLGVGVHLGGESDAQLAQKIADLSALGLRAARIDADWASIETAPGRYDFTSLDRVVAALQAGGLRPLLIADYRNRLYDGGRTPSSAAAIAAFARFTAAVAARYPDADIDVYNEYDFRFNDGACGTSPQCYLRLLRPTAQAVEATGARGTVAGPDIAGTGVQQSWLQGFIDGGGLGSVGALDFHPYVQPDRPEVLDPQLDALAASLGTAGASDKPVWFTEFGTSTVPGWATEQQQAEDVARVVGVAATHGVGRIYWYDAVDDGPDRQNLEHNFGLFRAPTSLAPDALVPKPAAAVIATTARLATGAAVAGEAGPLRTVRFGNATTLLWAPDDETRAALRGGGHLVTMTGRSARANGSLTVTGSPVWLTGGAAARPR